MVHVLEKTLFDGDAMIRALDAQRADRGLDWNDLADALYEQSSELNAELDGNHVCQGALVRTAQRGTMSCQYAVMILRWINSAPENFLRRPSVHVGETDLPVAGPDVRLRFDLPALHAALDAYRRQQGLTWAALSVELNCTANRLTNLRTGRLADMDLTMRITQHLQRPAAAFIQPARW